ncbi:hypothetical protein I203_103675 [Kwoniella mangroviensis CBS 8507]|uniref:uncharacterized protein n=1 Tax=Kwoniella mangroviensis CBS 8507 TaxID=1296122 RepID=UPI00080D0390|nr:uncharacterized protein I203_04231 [Kwoniella mangroviensis CBS 8507]OCF66655.1 hypothetical protein I203_04231 [Kwoniella mangroviensis CBS 8507]
MSGPEPTPLSILTTPKLFFLAGKTIIISGGGRGLGLSVARGVLEAGANVAAVDLLPLFEKVFEDASPSAPVHDMFLAAGVPPSLTVLDSSIEYWRKVFDVNTAGSFLCCKAFANEWLSRNKTNGNPGVGGASIVLTASVAGHNANRQIPCSAYSASKTAVIHMAKSFAAEWGKLGIRVNAVSPGYIKTVMTAGIVAARPGYEEDMVNSTLLGRASTGDEYRGPAVFLLSEASSFVIGADIVVDGGHAA